MGQPGGCLGKSRRSLGESILAGAIIDLASGTRGRAVPLPDAGALQGRKTLKESIIYNIPAAMADAYPGQSLILRSREPSELARRVASCDPERIAYLQIPGVGGDVEELLRADRPVPVDVVVEDPEADLPRLYRFAPVAADRPVRISVPVSAGFHKVVKLALSLHFAVKLEPAQPGPEMTDPLLQVADLYLHQSTVSQPVEYLHSLFLAFYHGAPVSLWAVQEEDPSCNRFVTDRGVETISRRFAEAERQYDFTSFPEKFAEELVREKRECHDCPFFETCLGYFKWPRKEYRCDGVRAVFELLRKAGRELKKDLASFASSGRETQS